MCDEHDSRENEVREDVPSSSAGDSESGENALEPEIHNVDGTAQRGKSAEEDADVASEHEGIAGNDIVAEPTLAQGTETVEGDLSETQGIPIADVVPENAKVGGFPGEGNEASSANEAPDQSNKAFRMSKRAFAIVILVVVALLVIGFVSTVVIPRQTYEHAIELTQAGSYSEAIQAFEESQLDDYERYISYCNGMIELGVEDYQAAIDDLIASEGIEDADTQVITAKGLWADQLYSGEEYQRAADLYSEVGNTEKEREAGLAYGDQLFDSGDYQAALDVYEKYEDAERVAKAQDAIEQQRLASVFDEAESHFQSQDYSSAREEFASLPEGYERNGVSSSTRVGQIDAAQPVLDAAGRYSGSGSFRSKEIWSAGDGRWESWDYDDVPCSCVVECSINDDGSVTVTVSASYTYAYTYSSLSRYVKQRTATTDFTATVRSMSEFSATENNATLTYSNGTFSLSYYNYVDNESAYFDYEYTGSYTYAR